MLDYIDFWSLPSRKWWIIGIHRIFTLRCIKVRVTPISCRIKNPLHVKMANSYDIIHKVERQLLHERVRNIK